jgi:alanine dehydrogenase
MIIGVATEIKTDEHRVALTPAGVRELTGMGHQVLVERGAGVGSSIRDADFQATGATIVNDADDVWASADLVLKVKEPIEAEYGRLSARENQVLFTYLHLAASRSCTDALVKANNVAIAYGDRAPRRQLTAVVDADE